MDGGQDQVGLEMGGSVPARWVGIILLSRVSTVSTAGFALWLILSIAARFETDQDCAFRAGVDLPITSDLGLVYGALCHLSTSPEDQVPTRHGTPVPPHIHPVSCRRAETTLGTYWRIYALNVVENPLDFGQSLFRTKFCISVTFIPNTWLFSHGLLLLGYTRFPSPPLIPYNP